MINLKFGIKLFLKNRIFKIRYKKLISETLKSNNIKKEKNVILLGTGKSISLLDPQKIQKLRKDNFEVFSLGGFIQSEFSKNLEIDYYLLSDERTINPEKFELEKNHKEKLINTINILNKKKIKLFLPTYSNKKHHFINKILYYNNYSDRESKNISDITKYLGYSSISGLKALTACIHLGYKKIYICGFDNNHWNNIKVDENNKIFQINRHFYDNDEYLQNFTTPSVGNLLNKSSGIFKSYDKFKKYNIVNLDPNGLIDSFTKKHNLDIYINKNS